MEPFFSELKVLTDLGLTVTSARVYSTLVKHDSLELSTLAKRAHIARPDVYRTLRKLQELGLIEKILEHPTKYRAIPKKEALSLLLDAKTEKYREVKKETEFLIKTADTKEAHTIDLLPKPKFVFISPGKGLTNKIKTAIDKAQFSVYSVLSWKRFSQGILNRFPESFEKAVARKVDMRFIVEAPSKSRTVKELIEFCSRKYGLQLRCAPDKPKTYFSIFDRKEILIVAISQSGFKSSPVLWSNSSALVALGLDHFEELWCKVKNC